MTTKEQFIIQLAARERLEQIVSVLTTLQVLKGQERDLENTTWATVGMLTHIASQLKEVKDFWVGMER